MIEKLNLVSTNVWAMIILIAGTVLGCVCVLKKVPLELPGLIIGGGLAILQHKQSS